MLPDRVFGTTDDGEIEFVPYKVEHLAGFKECLSNNYYAGECFANGLGINLPAHQQARDDLTRICVDTLRDGLSIVARVRGTGQIVGHVVNKLIFQDKSGAPSYFEAFMRNECQSPASKEYLRVMLEMDDRVDMFAFNGTDVLLEVMFLGVDARFTRRAIGLKLVECSLRLGGDLKAGNKELERLPHELRGPARRLGGATALYASNYSKAIGERLGFVVHDEVFFDRMTFEGKVLQDRIPDPRQRSMKLMSVRI